MSEDLFELLKGHVEMPQMVKGMTITLEMRTPVQIDCTYYPIKYDRDEKDRLNAAAPDLLDALKAIVKSLADQDDEGLIEHAQQMIDARTAIAKATGSEA